MPVHHGTSGSDPVAVIGAGCRAPGGVNSLGKLWQLLRASREVISLVPEDRWSIDEISAEVPQSIAGRIRHGGFLEGDIHSFDPQAFGLSGSEAEWLDPQHRLLLMLAWEACENAGLPLDRLRGSNTGVFAGIYWMDHLLRGHRPASQSEAYWYSGGMHGVGVGRVSFLLDLHGPSLSVDTACSSGLVAVHLACQALRSGECSLALACAVAAGLGPEVTVAESRWEMLSPSGHCYAFDAKADGYVRGEGGGVVVLKLLKDALRDGDRVLAVLRGSAVNQDGRSVRLTAPSATAQAAVFTRALQNAGLRSEEIGMIEAHGTGTPVGDPLEFTALNEVYGAGEQPCAIGSIKTNIGHTEAAAGMMGLLKAIACVQAGQVPATLHFTEWNPQIDPQGSRLFVPAHLQAWPMPDSRRVAAVSSYGVGGTNAHVIVEEPPDHGGRSSLRAFPLPTICAASRAGGQELHTLLLSASSAGALRTSAARVADWLEADGSTVPLEDVVHTLAIRRSHDRHRGAVIARDRGTLRSRLRALAGGQDEAGVVVDRVRPSGPGAVFVYSGHGSQWSGMTQGLLDVNDAFTRAIEELEPLIRQEGGFSLRECLSDDRVVEGVERVQPTLFGVQFALTRMWASVGIEPVAVIGHSMGEVAAAVACGALSAQDGVKVICRRSRLLRRVTGGAMATVRLGHEQVAETLTEFGADGLVEVAVMAAKDSTVISGETEHVTALLQHWERVGVPATQVRVDVASHSAHMDPILPELAGLLTDLTPRQPRCPFYTTVATDPRETVAFDAEYWVANQRRVVRFAQAVQAAAADGHRLFIEVNAHPLLGAAVAATAAPAAGAEVTVLPTLRRDGDEPVDFAAHVAAAHCAGLSVPWDKNLPSGQLVDAPPTCWEPGHHKVEASPLTRSRLVAEDESATHPLLGTHIADPLDAERHLWRAAVPPAATRWLQDHQAAGVPTMPGAVWCDMALAAAAQLHRRDLNGVRVENIAFKSFLPLHPAPGRLISRTGRQAGLRIWQVTTSEDEQHVETHATATLALARDDFGREDQSSLDTIRSTCSQPVDVEGFYRALPAGCRVDFGPAFHSLKSVHRSPAGQAPRALAELTVPEEAQEQAGMFGWHPILLDGCLQTLLALWLSEAELPEGQAYAHSISALQITGDVNQGRFCHVRVEQMDGTGCTGSFQLLDGDGAVVGWAEGVRFVHTPDHSGAERLQRYMHEQRWQSQELDTPSHEHAGHWLVVTESPGQAHDSLVAELRDRVLSARERTIGWDEDIDAALRVVDSPFSPCTDLLVVTEPDCGDDERAVHRACQRTARLIELVQYLVRRERPGRLHILTRHAQAVTGHDTVALAQAGSRGLLRTLTYEHPELSPRLIDTDAVTAPAALVDELLADQAEDEVAYREGRRHVARITPAPLTDQERRRVSCQLDEQPIRAVPSHSGLVYVLESAPKPSAGEVTVQVKAICRPHLGERPLSSFCTCSGVVLEGSDDLSPWSAAPVLALLPAVPWSSRLAVDSSWLVPLPADADAVALAASLPSYFAAHYAFHRIGRIRPGDRVLIHGAHTATGQAALRIAETAGGRVSATPSGSRPEDPYTTVLTTPAQTPTAPPDQFDLVLDLIGDDTAQDLARFIASGGLMVTVSEVIASAHRANTAVAHLDLEHLLSEDPPTASAVLKSTALSLVEGELPLLPSTTHSLERLAQHDDRFDTRTASLYQWPRAVTAEVPPGHMPVATPDGGYIISGGLGGLGMAVAAWLAEAGAGTVVLNSRSEPSAQTRAAISELQAAGTCVEVICADIADPATAPRLVEAAQRHGHRLRGIIHAAAVVDDALMNEITPDLLRRVWLPKAVGAWHLHKVSIGHRLDWFIAFSSFVSQVGSPGQTAYAAASAWLDELMTYRAQRNLPALGINWGAWAEVGLGARTLGYRGWTPIPVKDALECLRQLLAHTRVRSSVIDIDFDIWLRPYPQSVRAPILSPLQGAASDPAVSRDSVREHLFACDEAERPGRIQQYLAEQAADLLHCSQDRIDPHTSLVSLGMDSLTTVQLRNRLQQDTGIVLPGAVLWTKPTTTALAEYILDHLQLPPG
ncbi:SDR family NAD(P)-dependent oxidoreductase [Streptomyces sp. NPDC047821]|uniref:SDR family NAD(P)-dependent oxidoreductase n=1 Tax=Streptomyces sp. NPDC047821 TaxID=3365488 RepID=UPI00371BB281